MSERDLLHDAAVAQREMLAVIDLQQVQYSVRAGAVRDELGRNWAEGVAVEAGALQPDRETGCVDIPNQVDRRRGRPGAGAAVLEARVDVAFAEAVPRTHDEIGKRRDV